MLNKLLVLAFLLLIVGRLFFRPQLRKLGQWLDGAVNALLIAIVIAYALQAALWMSSGP